MVDQMGNSNEVTAPVDAENSDRVIAMTGRRGTVQMGPTVC